MSVKTCDVACSEGMDRLGWLGAVENKGEFMLPMWMGSQTFCHQVPVQFSILLLENSQLHTHYNTSILYFNTNAPVADLWSGDNILLITMQAWTSMQNLDAMTLTAIFHFFFTVLQWLWWYNQRNSEPHPTNGQDWKCTHPSSVPSAGIIHNTLSIVCSSNLSSLVSNAHWWASAAVSISQTQSPSTNMPSVECSSSSFILWIAL